MTRNRVAGQRRHAGLAIPEPLIADPARIIELEHETGIVARGEHPIDVPCYRCLGHRPGDDHKRVLRQRRLEAAVASGREYRLIHAMGDDLPIRVLYMDGQPPPVIDETPVSESP